mmetsp:Transcript_32175/g.54038  ORF Transcript_32175/g.54038 Transcript_32175/m.54038 type:complete len:354 (-) Transcript_32175:481-1542(-)
MNLFSRNRDGHSDYNALGESLMSDPQGDNGQQEDVGVTIASQGFGNTTETRPRSSRPQSAISSLENGMGRLGRGLRNLMTPAAANGSDGQRTTSAGMGASVYNPSVTRNSAPPNNAHMPAEEDILKSCRETVAAGRVASELLRDTTQQAQENPLEAVVLGDTLNQLSRVCMDNQNTLTMMLSSEVLLTDEVLLMETLEVNESLSLALEHFLAFSAVTPQQAQEQQPVRQTQQLDLVSGTPQVGTRVSDSLGEQAAEPEGETEEEMIARAIAESLKSEEEYKTRGLVEAAAGLAQPPPPPPPPPPQAPHLSTQLPLNGLFHGLDDLIAPPPSSDPVPTPPLASSPPPAPTNLLD